MRNLVVVAVLVLSAFCIHGSYTIVVEKELQTTHVLTRFELFGFRKGGTIDISLSVSTSNAYLLICTETEYRQVLFSPISFSDSIAVDSIVSHRDRCLRQPVRHIWLLRLPACIERDHSGVSQRSGRVSDLLILRINQLRFQQRSRNKGIDNLFAHSRHYTNQIRVSRSIVARIYTAQSWRTAFEHIRNSTSNYLRPLFRFVVYYVAGLGGQLVAE